MRTDKIHVNGGLSVPNLVHSAHFFMSKSSNNQILISGRNMVLDALKSDRTITRVVIADHVEESDVIEEIKNLAKIRNIAVGIISGRKLEPNAQGVAAYMDDDIRVSVKSILASKENPVFLLYNKLDYDQNLGAILRTSWATGVDTVICATNGAHKITPAVAKISQGAAAYVPVLGQSLFQAIDVLQSANVPIVGVEVGKGEIYYKQNLIGPVAFLFGGESVGISDPLMKKCDLFIHIPMMGSLASINVSVATAVIMFEKRRQEKI